MSNRAEIEAWYRANNCSHAHCKYDCEHPQPFVDYDTGELLCGRCWHVENQRTVMNPCVPGVCE